MSKFSKKIIPLLVIAAFIFALIPTVISAGNSAHVSISVSPRELAESGSVTVTITITNTNSSSGPSNTTPPSVTNPPSTPTDPPSHPTEPPVAERQCFVPVSRRRIVIHAELDRQNRQHHDTQQG